MNPTTDKRTARTCREKNDISKRSHPPATPEPGLRRRKPLRIRDLHRPGTSSNLRGGPCPPPNEPKLEPVCGAFPAGARRARVPQNARPRNSGRQATCASQAKALRYPARMPPFRGREACATRTVRGLVRIVVDGRLHEVGDAAGGTGPPLGVIDWGLGADLGRGRAQVADVASGGKASSIHRSPAAEAMGHQAIGHPHPFARTRGWRIADPARVASQLHWGLAGEHSKFCKAASQQCQSSSSKCQGSRICPSLVVRFHSISVRLSRPWL